MIDIPLDRLQPELLEAIIEEFVLREGTEYGLREYSLEEKKAQVRSQLAAGKAKITFDQETETCSIMPVRGK